jgi:hypothetical protein
MRTKAARFANLRHLAVAINQEHGAVLSGVRSTMRHARRCGALLVEARDRCEHGHWLVWLSNHCPHLSLRTSQVYMRLARLAPAADAELDKLTIREVLERLLGHSEEANARPAAYSVSAVVTRSDRGKGSSFYDGGVHTAAEAAPDGGLNCRRRGLAGCGRTHIG